MHVKGVWFSLEEWNSIIAFVAPENILVIILKNTFEGRLTVLDRIKPWFVSFT